ncbi:hypothetical protein E9531_15070 [Lampropedia puyangensis]|uniref:Uncharacterized protein n=1 Tax=Lampropedia puyangensis TaxID=1330072 RepID=A0A4S8EUK1_9BURK|nr:hypothetical protein E9531_15070 [Lampropedia puyangensis]
MPDCSTAIKNFSEIKKPLEDIKTGLGENNKVLKDIEKAIKEATAKIPTQSGSQTGGTDTEVKGAVDNVKGAVDGVKDAVNSGNTKLEKSLKDIETAIKNQKPGVGGGGGGDGGEGDGEGENDLEEYCKKNKEALPCQKVGEFESSEGPSEPQNIQITYQSENLFGGGGTCPADVISQVGGQSMTIWNWTQACGIISGYVKPVVIVLAFMSALMILIPRS